MVKGSVIRFSEEPPNQDALAERALVARARAGDVTSFEMLVVQHQDAVYRLALRMVGSRAAEDIAQQAFIKAWRGLDGFRGSAAFGTWVYRVAINLCLDQARREHHTRSLPLDAAERTLSTGGDLADAVATAEERAAQRAALSWGLARLPAEDRLLLHLRVGEGLSYERIGVLLDVGVNTVATRLFRARARLRMLARQRLEETHGLF
jgi:RNA polymerase sigma-70 factor, ECF subfamily